MELAQWDALPPQLTWKEKIAFLAASMQAALPDYEPLPVEHVFGRGLYIRKMCLPAGYFFLGREHLTGHMVSLMKGSAILITPAGKKQYDGPVGLLTDPGFHTVAYMLTDCEVWTFHGNPSGSTDKDALEAKIFGSIEEMMALGVLVQQRLGILAA